MKKAKPYKNINQKSLFEEEERKEFIKANSIHYFFVWEDIEFGKDLFKIKPNNRNNIIFKPIQLKGSLAILNEIKNEYFDRLYHKPFKLYYYQNEFQAWLGDWGKITRLIEAAIEYSDFKLNRIEGKHKVGKFKNLEPKEIINLFNTQISKSQYLKYLAAKQDETYRVIPILEYQNSQWEESFVFRLRTLSDRILIVWENAKEGRATHLFIADRKTIDERLFAIESFIIGSIDAKRTLLHDSSTTAKKIKHDLMYIDSINHKNLQNFKTELQYLLNRY